MSGGMAAEGEFGILASMDIEQKYPKQPNFLLIVGLFCVTILVIFVLAYLFVDFDGKHLTFHHRRAHPTSELVMPGRSGAEAHAVAQEEFRGLKAPAPSKG
jgi:hypothetical protein